MCLTKPHRQLVDRATGDIAHQLTVKENTEGEDTMGAYTTRKTMGSLRVVLIAALLLARGLGTTAWFALSPVENGVISLFDINDVGEGAVLTGRVILHPHGHALSTVFPLSEANLAHANTATEIMLCTACAAVSV